MPKPILIVRYDPKRYYTGSGKATITETNELFHRIFGEEYMTFAYPENAEKLNEELFNFEVLKESSLTEEQYNALEKKIGGCFEELKKLNQ